jgi:hypothetical protein
LFFLASSISVASIRRSPRTIPRYRSRRPRAISAGRKAPGKWKNTRQSGGPGQMISSRHGGSAVRATTRR